MAISVTFSELELAKLVESGIVEGRHTIDDVLETKNSIEAFGYLIDTLGEPLSKKFVCSLNAVLLDKTQMDADGFVGKYKTIPSRIRNSGVQVALPIEVPEAMERLFTQWERSEKTLRDVTQFHVRFEHIHPFQDGNGRIGRFLMLKQCIENDIDIVVVDDEQGDAYKAWLEVAQTQGDDRFLVDVFEKCQRRFDEKMRNRGISRLVEAIPPS